MEVLSTDYGIDLEAQQSLQVEQMSIPQESGPSQASLVSSSQQVAAEAQPVVSQDEGHVESEVHEMNILQSSKPEDATHHTPTQGGQNQVVAQDNPVTADPPNDISDGEHEEKPMIGDFDGGANALWTLYGKEAKSHDQARIQTLKEDMDGVLIFAGLFSAALTAFTIDSKQNLKPSNSDQMVYYLQQNVAMLNQISHQISSIAPQVSIPSTPPAPFPAFKPLASDIRINVFWFMALVFSLSAALLATLVQQWVRDYMHVFQRYGDPLKSARLRQYLHEGSEGWYMPVVAEAVPGLLHISLFLFFGGLCDSVLNINTAVGLSTTIPIGIMGLLYIFTMFAPILYPQSPYQSSFSGLIWYLFQKLHGRRYKDRDSKGELKSVSSDMAQGQMQLAMEETEERKCRDGRAIRWLIGNLTEDAEMESFVMAIPGSFTTEWGAKVWKKVSGGREDGSKSRPRNEPVGGLATDTDGSATSPLVIRRSRISIVWNVFSSIIRQVRARTGTDSPTPTNTMPPFPMSGLSNVHQDPDIGDMQGEVMVHELSGRVSHLLDKCNDKSLFASEELWHRLTQACIETTASLVFCANANFDWFGNPSLGRELTGYDLYNRQESTRFISCWSCLSLVTIQSVLERQRDVQQHAISAARLLKAEADTGYGQAQTVAQTFEEAFETAWRCLTVLSEELPRLQNWSQQQVEEILRRHESTILDLELINIKAESFRLVDLEINAIRSSIFSGLGQVIQHLRGVSLGFFDFTDGDSDAIGTIPLPLGKIGTGEEQFTLPRRLLKSICSIVPTFREILKGRLDVRVYKDTLENMKEFLSGSKSWRDDLQSQLWRLQDLNEGGGLCYSVELFFLALWQLMEFYQATQYSLYIGTFRVITANWRDYKHSLGTQILLLNILTSDHFNISEFGYYSTGITDEFFVLLGNILEGQTGPHIDDVVRKLSSLSVADNISVSVERRAFYAKALEVITRAQA